jgi:hypothetical protein
MGPRRRAALGALLSYVPGRATWFVGLGRPAALVHGAARFWKLLAQIPDLSAPMTRVAQRLVQGLGAWPPSPAQWRDLGIDPGGGVVLAGVAAGANRRSGFLALAFTQTPQRLLKRLVGPAGVPVGSSAQAVVQGGGVWWCGPLSVGVACASSRALLEETVAQGAKPPTQTLVARLPAHNWRDADLVGGWRAQTHAPITLATVTFRSWGIEAQVRLRGGELSRWLGWLGASSARRGRPVVPVAAVAAVWLHLDASRVSTLVGMLPANTVETSEPGALSLVALLAQCTGEAMLVVGPKGWRMRAVRRASKTVVDRPVRWKVSGWPVWARAPAGSLLIASTAAGTRPATGTRPTLAVTPGGTPPRPVGVGPTPQPLRRLVTGAAPLAMLVPLMDPLEPLTDADRVRLVAALAGLPAGERAFVGLVRGLLTLIGEVGVSVEKTSDGAVVRISGVSPATGSVSAQRVFDRLWRAKWLGGGLFDRQGLARVASRHPSTPLARLSRAVVGLRLGSSPSRWLTDALLRLLRRLSGPELSCAALAARLERCREPLAKLRSPQRWREMERVGLPKVRLRLKRSLLDRVRREEQSLGAHCDRFGGRLENAQEVSACLGASDCPEFARCLTAAFTPKK